MTWPLERPLSRLSCLVLWREATGRVPPPEPFVADVALLEALDDAYVVLVRNGIAPQGEAVADTPLIEWRQKTIGAFEELAADCQGFHPVLLPARLTEVVCGEIIGMPDTIILAAFEAPAPIEKALFESMEKVCSVKRFDLPAGSPETLEAVVLPSRDQEVTWLARQLVSDARHVLLNRIGVVIPDTETYLARVKQAMAEILGDPLDHNQAAYNISAPTRLVERALVQAGIVPLRFWLEGQTRTLLLSLLLSPYYSRWATQRDLLARADRLWRKEGVDSGLKSLLGTVSGRSPEFSKLINGKGPALDACLGNFREKSLRTGAQWVDTLEGFWKIAGFPVISDEADKGAWAHLRNVLCGMREDLASVSMELAEFSSLLRHVLSRELVHVRGSEEAGIQVLGLIESRGMSFERLYVLGLAAGSLPRPVRPLPLLSLFERRRVQGATVESQHEFARAAFSHLLACSRHVSLIRPMAEGTEPLAPCPFWFQVVGEETAQVVDHWNAPDEAWARAAWLRGAFKGLANPQAFPAEDPPVDKNIVPDDVSVSLLSVAFACPFRFFAESALKVFPLEELVLGISPKTRGSLIHKALAIFTGRCRRRGLKGKGQQAVMLELLQQCVEEALTLATGETACRPEDTVCNHAWEVERRRWMGEHKAPFGLLAKWLELELERLEDGWQWVDEETPFEGLEFDGWPFSVSGRIDRIDYHRQHGIMMWDYKSGEHPPVRAVVQDLTEPQIPAYILAAKAERISEIKEHVGAGVPVSGGYISLRTAPAISHKALTPKGRTWDEVLETWKEAVSRLGKMLAAGQFRADPYCVSNHDGKNDKACRYCPYRPLCGRQGKS